MKPKRILIADTDSSQCDTLEACLSNAGYLVYSAVSSTEAGKLSVGLMPHIAILDEVFFDGDTSSLLEEIRKTAPDCHFIIQSGHLGNGVEASGLAGGTLRHIKKPVTPEKLLKVMAHVCEIVDLSKEKRHTEASLLKRNLELEDINERLRQIVESTRRLTSFSGTGDLGPVILHEFAGNMNAKGGSLFLHNNKELVLVYSLDKKHVPERIPLPLNDRSVIAMVLAHHEPVLIEDIRKEQPLLASGYQGYSDHSLLAFPMLEKNGAIVGVITLHNKITPPFTRQDKELGAILASYGSETLRATQAIEELKRSEEKARIILEANPDPVLVFDNEKKVKYLNPAFSRVFGWSLEERCDRAMDHFIPEKSLAHARMMDEIERKGESYSGIETYRYSREGQLIPVSISGASFSDSSGMVLGSVCNIRDITDQKTMEEQLIQSQKMEAIGTLASGIAHDFNNILSAIFGNLDLAFMDMPANIPGRKNIENVMKAAHRAKDLVGQILSFSRKSDRDEDVIRKIQPHLIIKEALILLRASLPSTIEIQEKIMVETATIHADPTQFHQIIMNLCTNAHHAMKENGGILSIGLETCCDVLEGEKESKPCHLKLTVSDTGCGMDEKTLKRIYDPYFTTKDKHLGTGLGLSVVRKIVTDCNGRISVFTNPGQGTRFELLFPEAGCLEKQSSAPVSTIGKGSGHILFVDDESDIASLGAFLLQRLGYTVDALTRPLEALERVKADPFAFDMVITDMTMPKMTGTRLAEAMKAVRPDLPVILCTGFNRSEIQEGGHAQCIDAILKKPVDLRDFSETIERFLVKKIPPTTRPPVQSGLTSGQGASFNV